MSPVNPTHDALQPPLHLRISRGFTFRPATTAGIEKVKSGRPYFLLGRGTDLSVALQALVAALNSMAVREASMIDSRFPLQGDMPAFLLVNQLMYRTTARPTHMADAIGAGRSKVSKIVRRLEGAGLVGRKADPQDGRRSEIGLTTARREEVASRIVQVSSGAYKVIFGCWRAEEFSQLVRLVARGASIDDRLDQAIDAPGRPRIHRKWNDRAGNDQFRQPRVFASTCQGGSVESCFGA